MPARYSKGPTRPTTPAPSCCACAAAPAAAAATAPSAARSTSTAPASRSPTAAPQRPRSPAARCSPAAGGAAPRHSSSTAVDNIGIQAARARIDGAVAGGAGRACNFGQKVPCSNGSTSLAVPTAGLADGSHQVSGEAVDASGNVSGAVGRTVNIDNTAPTQPLELQACRRLRAGARRTSFSWRGAIRRSASRRSPARGFSCARASPANASPQARARARARCVLGGRGGRGADDDQGPQAAKPRPVGPQAVADRLGRQPAAGQRGRDQRARLRRHSADRAGLRRSRPERPGARARCSASDAVSGLASAAIEVRRDGQNAWQPLSDAGRPRAVRRRSSTTRHCRRACTSCARGWLTRRDWRLRPTARRTADPAVVRLPIRAREPAARRPPRASPLPRRALTSSLPLPLGEKAEAQRRTRDAPVRALDGRRQGDARHAGWRCGGGWISIGAGWKRIGAVTTSRTGRFSYRAAPRAGSHDPLPLPGHEHDPRTQRRRRAARARRDDVAAAPSQRAQRRATSPSAGA